MRLVPRVWAFALLVRFSTAQDDPKPLVIPASQHFEGNDGPWSTFDVRVGEPEQYLRVLVSTASPLAFVPVTEACSDAVFETVPPDCAISRGKLFNLNDSSSWQDLGLFALNENGIGLGGNLGYEARVQYGLDNLGIGLNGPRLENQTIGGFATPEPLYLGVFGLNNQPFNFTILGNHPREAFITTLKDQGKIPSLSWSYTAGAQYRLKQVYGQLIFSGYDTSRFEENSVSFTMAEDITRDLVVVLQSISYSGSQSKTLFSDSIDIMIDSTDPNIWLPEEACTAFEEAFGLRLDPESGLYLVNDTHRNQLLDSNAEVSFRLSDVKARGETVTITLPYAAFDLTAEPPLVKETSHYFPLKRANTSTQYTLGRTFLQEAYLTADYERKTFNISSCVWNQGARENIIVIPSLNGTGSSPGDPSSGPSLSKGELAGIIIGSILGFLLLVAILTIFILRKRRKWIGHGFAVAAVSDPHKPSADSTVFTGPVFASSSRHGSSPDGVPFSADDISASRNSRSTTGTRPGSAVGVGNGNGNGKEMAELDGRDTAVRSGVQLPGALGVAEVDRMPAVREDQIGVFELPGTGVGGMGSREIGHGESKVSALVGDERATGEPPSPLTATATWSGGNGNGSGSGSGSGEGVSPDSPVYKRGGRPF